MKLSFSLLKDTFTICKFKNEMEIPSSIKASPFYSITRTADELSVVCEQSRIPEHFTEINRDWCVLKVIGPLDFSLMGIIADISAILKSEEISIFTISTYQTDYVLVKSSNVDKAIEALKTKGHTFI